MIDTATPETITGEVALMIGGESVKIEVTVPLAPTPLTDLLPLFHAITSSLVDRAVLRDAAPGRVVSCRAGCGACCRQAVPIAPSEARALAALVEAMPEPRQSIIRERFAAARATLAAKGVGTRPEGIAGLPPEGHIAWHNAYMAAAVPCPFLEDESCSIHPVRPTICREYLVTTPAENCVEPGPDNIRRVPLPGSVSSALFSLDATLENHGRLLLIDSLDWVATHPAPPPTQPGPAIVQTAFAALAAKS